MKTLTKQALKERDALSQRLQYAYQDLETEVELYNETTAAQWKSLSAAGIFYQRVVEEAKSWCEDVAAQIQEEIDSHHEKWQDSDRGQAFVQWQQEYAQHNLGDLDLEQLEPLILEAGDQSDVLEALPEEP